MYRTNGKRKELWKVTTRHGVVFLRGVKEGTKSAGLRDPVGVCQAFSFSGPTFSRTLKKIASPLLVAPLAGVLSCNQKVASSIPNQGTYLGCGFVPQSGCMHEAMNQCFSLSSMFLSSCLHSYLKVMKKMSSGEDLKKKSIILNS